MSKDRAAQLVEAGIWLKLSGDREGARKLFERALKLDPQNEKAAQLLAGAPAPGESELPPAEPVAPAPPQAPMASQPTPMPMPNPFEPPASSPSANDLDWGMATGFKVAASAEASLESDWGRMTGSTTPAPPPVPVAPPAKQTAMLWNSSGSGLTAAPKQTLPGWGMTVRPAEPLHGSAMPELAPQTISLSGAAPAESPPRSTPPLFSAPPPMPELQPQTVNIGGDPGPEVPPPSTPPLFGSFEPPTPDVRTVEIAGAAPWEPPPASTPPLFESPPSFETPPFIEPPRTATDPMGFAWSWSASSPAPQAPPLDVPPLETPEPPAPRPSPWLAPRAESAWDARSNPGIKLEAVVGHDRALDLISSDSKLQPGPQTRKDEIRAILRGARDLLELDDHTGAMELILKAQHISPDDPDVLAMRERSEKTLLNMFESKLGKLETIPRVLLKDDEIIWLNLDHRAGFVLAQIDGTVSFDDLFSVSGMSRIDTARILAQLIEEGVINRG